MTNKEFIKKYLSLYNNVGISPSEGKRILENAQLALPLFIRNEFPDNEFKIFGREILDYPRDDEFFDSFSAWYQSFKEDLNNSKQTKKEKFSHGNHDYLYDNLFDSLRSLIAFIKEN